MASANFCTNPATAEIRLAKAVLGTIFGETIKRTLYTRLLSRGAFQSVWTLLWQHVYTVYQVQMSFTYLVTFALGKLSGSISGNPSLRRSFEASSCFSSSLLVKSTSSPPGDGRNNSIRAVVYKSHCYKLLNGFHTTLRLPSSGASPSKESGARPMEPSPPVTSIRARWLIWICDIFLKGHQKRNRR